GRRAVYLFRRSRRRYARVQHKPRRAQPRREPLSARTPPQASDGLIFEGRRETSMDAKGLKADVPSGKTASPDRLIDETALRWHRRRLSELLLPVLPPVLAAAIALAADRLPVEIGVAGTIALAIFGFYLTGLVVSRLRAARFLDRSLGAKDRFLTLATVERAVTLLSVVESGAAAIAASAGDLPLPPRRNRPLVASAALSVVGLLFLWVIPDLALHAGAGGGGLDRIAAELAAGDAADQELARALRDVSNVLHDPRRSN